ncbi:hypothetical protein WA158_007056 [Blastocystis sp. Blastoise]
MRTFLFILLVTLAFALPSVDCQSKPQADYPYCNPELSIDERVDDLVSRMTLEEAIFQTWSEAPAIEHLGMKDYNWRANCQHGWSASGGKWYDLKWNNFPAPIGLGATFDIPLIKKVAVITANEGRALHNILLEKNNGSTLEAAGINCFSPNVNLFRDPRWGRGQETFGEDPYLISMIGGAYTTGLQEHDGNYYKIAACAKHFAAHSGPEEIRYSFTVNSSEHDLYDTFFPQFETQARCVNVLQIMPAYTALKSKESPEGRPDVANNFLLEEVLRKRWNRPEISIMSDNTAVQYIWSEFNLTNKVDATWIAFNATTDIDLGPDKQFATYLMDNVKNGHVKEQQIRDAVKRSMRLRMLVGDFDPKDKVEYQNWGYEHLNTPEYKAVNLKTTQESLVLLRNRANILPLNIKKYPRIGIVGNNADHARAYISIYEAIPDHIFTVKESIETYAKERGLPTPLYSPGCTSSFCPNYDDFPAVVDMAKDVDVIVAVLGLDENLEDERHDRQMKQCNNVDTPMLGLPGCQAHFLQYLKNFTSVPVILVMIHGAPITIPDFVDTAIDAFYPGQFGGNAVADILFGDYNPAGRLPYTILKDDKYILPNTDYDFISTPGRTYKYFKGEIQFPFGYGLSYSTFQYTVSKAIISPCDDITIKATITNLGPFDGDEVIQVYVSSPQTTYVTPIHQLMGFERVTIKNGDSYAFSYTLSGIKYSVVNLEGKRVFLPGTYTIYIGGGQPGSSSGTSVQFNVIGSQEFELTQCPEHVPQYFCMDF